MFGARLLTCTAHQMVQTWEPCCSGVSLPQLCEGGGFIDPIFQSSKVSLLSDRRGQSYPDGQSQSRGRTQLGDRLWISGAAGSSLGQSRGSTSRSDDGKGAGDVGTGRMGGQRVPGRGSRTQISCVACSFQRSSGHVTKGERDR